MEPQTLSLIFLLLATATASFNPVASTDTILTNTSLTGNQTLISTGGIYALGFFSPSGADGRTYLGIWYASIPGSTTIVWVANRVNPVISSPGVLQLSPDGRLVILDGNNVTVWTSPAPTRNVSAHATARLLDSGNFVLSSDGSGSDDHSVAWQSFDYPTDTLLPGMKLGVDIKAGITRNITSWRSPSDPSPGDYTFKLVIGGLPQFFLFQGGTKRIYTSGPWNGDILTGVPNLKSKGGLVFNVVSSNDETYYSYTISDPSLFSRLLVVNSKDGQLRRFSLKNGAWSDYSFYPTEPCDHYNRCGPFGYCNPDLSSACDCLPGFVPRSPEQWNLQDWSDGCVRRTNLSCNGSDGFWVVNQMKLPQATDATIYEGLTLDQCRQTCLSNCSCRAYAAANMSGGAGVGCVLWTVDLLDMRQYPFAVEDVYIRLAQSEIDALKDAANRRRPLIILIVFGVVLLLAVCCCCFRMSKVRRKGHAMAPLSSSPVDDGHLFRARKRSLFIPVRDQQLDEAHGDISNDKNDIDLPLFDLELILVATDNFAEHKKIGSGGFGPVYAGNLDDGQQVAVKRLSCRSKQGVREFMNEVKLIAKLQHRNLVRLLGCCIDDDERMLVYEYMDNQSLDKLIFDERKHSDLRWQRRYEIILGISRGLQYLHEDSRFRIIHRDLKASNVLLDRNMVPKISDFGIARMFGSDQTSEYTGKVIGTYGYMSPEYAMDGIISVKSDVFSFGVLVLEIVTGRKNRGSYGPELDLNLLGYAWMLWKEGRIMELLDEEITGSFHHNKALRCIQVALLCIEAQPRNRPLMSSVVMMLASENVVLSEPIEPGVNIGRMNTSSDTESSQTRSATANYVTVTALQARDGVLGFLKVWNGDIEAHDSLKEEVEWGSQINSFFGMVRLKIAVKDPKMILVERLLEIGKKMFWVNFKVEGDIVQHGGLDDDGKGDEDDQEENKGNEKGNPGSKMDTDRPGNSGGEIGSKEKDREVSSNVATKSSKGSRIVPMWTSLFKDGTLEGLIPGEMSNFVGCNLLEDMELVGTEEESNLESQADLEMEMENLPNNVVMDLQQERAELELKAEGQNNSLAGVNVEGQPEKEWRELGIKVIEDGKYDMESKQRVKVQAKEQTKRWGSNSSGEKDNKE
ncbi:hypothetical protein QOZ80_1AG0035980 [Eleusine coracana subsp. coracana]|nr:hypothetical protein QOZ80_1AG0035980 [Eleusine coracana subsp. coracana]